ncbi:MAG: CRTAC1 family protein [Cyclobacteriaceae bacterium]
MRSKYARVLSAELRILIVPFFLLLFLQDCNQPSDKYSSNAISHTEKERLPTETLDMISKVREAVNRIDLTYAPYILSSKKIPLMKSELARIRGNERYMLLFSYGTELLNAGRTREAIDALEELLSAIGKTNNSSTGEARYLTLKQLAVAFMRLGEQENCLLNHNEESCIMPFSAKAQHIQREGSEKAIELLKEVLTIRPTDLDCQYLINVAYMTLGEYPNNVPEAYLIPPSYFNSSDFPPFKDIAMHVGVDENNRSGGLSMDDFNGDGYLDIIASSWGFYDQIKYFENDKQGGFIDKTALAGLNGVTGGLNLRHADYNNDGNMDFLILRGAWLSVNGRIPNSLMKNNGNGTFTDVTVESGIYSEHPTQTAEWLDVDLDGHLDLFIANEWDDYQNSHCELFHNQGDGTFQNISFKANINETGYYKGISSGDVNNDGYPDIYLSDYDGPNVLLINNSMTAGKPRFETAGPKANVSYPIASFPTWIFDYDNDGYEDIFVSGYSTPGVLPAPMFMENVVQHKIGNHPMLYHNNGDGTFNEVSIQMNLSESAATMGCNFGDLDNDGFLDFYLATGDPDYFSIVPNRMYRNVAGTKFEDVTYSGGFGHVQKGHAIGFGDIDMDGDQDIYAVMGGAYEGDVYRNLLFENPLGNENNWINILLQGTLSNRSAIGAKIILTIEESGEERKIYHTVGIGASFGGNSTLAEIGIGSAKTIKHIEIRWPHLSKPTSEFTDVSMNQTVRITEGGAIEALQLPTTPFKKGDHGHQHH